MRKLIAGASIALFLAGGSAFAASADPGPNDHNNHGLCTAYFNGSDNGQQHKRQAGPFDALMREAANSDGQDNDGDGKTDEGDETTDAAGVWDWCSDPANNPKGIGGTPTEP